TVGPDTPFDGIVETLIERRVSQVPVVDGSGLLLGIVTEADLLAKEAFGGHRPRALELVADYLVGREPKWLSKAAGLVAGDVMTIEVDTVEPGTDLAAAGRLML